MPPRSTSHRYGAMLAVRGRWRSPHAALVTFVSSRLLAICDGPGLASPSRTARLPRRLPRVRWICPKIRRGFKVDSSDSVSSAIRIHLRLRCSQYLLPREDLVSRGLAPKIRQCIHIMRVNMCECAHVSHRMQIGLHSMSPGLHAYALTAEGTVTGHKQQK